MSLALLSAASVKLRPTALSKHTIATITYYALQIRIKLKSLTPLSHGPLTGECDRRGNILLAQYKVCISTLPYM